MIRAGKVSLNTLKTNVTQSCPKTKSNENQQVAIMKEDLALKKL